MTLTRIIGDIHGKWGNYYALAKAGPRYSIQIGDFGMGFRSQEKTDEMIKFHARNPGHRFIRGNHDNPAVCKLSPGYIPDGFVQNDVMFVGGAHSIDYWRRTPGIDFWHDEELSIPELNNLISIYEIMKPRIMISHDGPYEVVDEMFISKGLGAARSKKDPSRTQMALQAMFEIHQPELWIFGHWHIYKNQMINGTKFQCLGELDWMNIEL